MRTPSEPFWLCPLCGPRVACDEDGNCATCGSEWFVEYIAAIRAERSPESVADEALGANVRKLVTRLRSIRVTWDGSERNPRLVEIEDVGCGDAFEPIEAASIDEAAAIAVEEIR